jgi:catechol 2,3-dioxygenase-like lactoylglutathione lyase family enzyme
MKFHSTVIFVQDIVLAKDFYTRFLNFTIEHDFGKNVILSNDLTLWEIGESHMINRQLETKSPSNRFELYFETEDIEAAFEMLNNAGIKFLHQIHEEPWGQRTIRFFDPDSHLIEIGEPLEVFVSNMSRRGLTITQISEKSGIPVETLLLLIKK